MKQSLDIHSHRRYSANKAVSDISAAALFFFALFYASFRIFHRIWGRPVDVTFHEDACRARDEIAAQNLTGARMLSLALSKRASDEIVEKNSHTQAKHTSPSKRFFLANLYPEFMIDILLACA